MKKLFFSILLLLFFCKGSYATNYIKIIFSNKDSVASSILLPNSTVQIQFKDSRLNTLFTNYSVTEYAKEYPIADSFPNYMTPVLNLRLVYRIRLSPSQSNSYGLLKASIDSINSSDLSSVILLDSILTLGTPPNDYYYSYQGIDYPQAHHHLDLVNALGAWDITTGLSCIKVGITDEAFQHHVDLDNKLIITPRTAYIAPTSLTIYHHGNETAGMCGAETNNNLGISSLGYNISMSYYNDNYEGILNAIYDGCKVVNCSWYSGFSSGSLLPLTPPSDIKSLLDLAKLNNVTIIAAAGNNNTGNPNDYFYPASYDGVISVTSVGSQWNVGDYSHPANWKDCHHFGFTSANDRTHEHNDRVDICAPGYYVESTADYNAYRLDEGTSFATPLVSATAALLYSINPFFTSSEIESYLKNNAVNIYGIADNNTWAGKLGAGRLNAGASLVAASSHTYNGPPYCINCPLETTYLTYTSNPQVSGYFYNKNINIGSGNTNTVITSSSESTSLVATNVIDLLPEFSAIATTNSSFSARIEPCILFTGRKLTNKKVENEYLATAKDGKRLIEGLKIYPSPANNIINIHLNTQQKGKVDILLFSSSSVLIKRFVTNINNGQVDFKTTLNNFSNGLYYVVCKTKEKKYFSKFIKLM